MTLRIAEGVPSLRTRPVLAIVHDAIRIANEKRSFRIVQFNVLTNHIHMIVEAENADALAHGMQGLKVRLARRINTHFGRAGELFADRYHARPLTTPSEVRNALRYVLLNEAHHDRTSTRTYSVDPYSSGAWFDGWADDRWQHELGHAPQPTAPPKTWLLATGWKKRGLIRFDETPGPGDRARVRRRPR